MLVFVGGGNESFKNPSMYGKVKNILWNIEPTLHWKNFGPLLELFNLCFNGAYGTGLNRSFLYNVFTLSLMNFSIMQVLKPATRKKLMIIEGNYQEVLSKCLQALPLFLGGNCSCSKCSDLGGTQGLTNASVPSPDFYALTGPGENDSNTLSPESSTVTRPTENYSSAPLPDSYIQSRGSENDAIVRSPDFYQHHTDTSGKRERVIWAAIVGFLVFWMFMAIAYPESLRLFYWQSGSWRSTIVFGCLMMVGVIGHLHIFITDFSIFLKSW